jgi:nitrile hydratase
MHGFGPVVREENEPVFHTGWERRAFALTLAMGAWNRWNLDMTRFARERMPPAAYLAASYYERWCWGLETLLVEQGFLTREELDRLEDRPRSPGALQPEALRAADVQPMLRRRRAARRDDPVPPRFVPGDRVRARNLNPAGHSRLPRYVRGRQGIIERDHGVFVFPDTHAAGLGEKPRHVYGVRFAGRELWGPEAPANDSVSVDLWEDYLDPA